MVTFRHGVKPEWGYATPQENTFIVVHPKTDREASPLYVVLHSAGHLCAESGVFGNGYGGGGEI